MAESSPATDYSPLKVADLKDKLKARGIPLTGLRLKQQFIDKLIEADQKDPQDISAADADKDSEKTPKDDPSHPEEDLTQQNSEDVEMTQPVEAAPLSTNISETNTNLSTPVPAQETLEDQQKRKRRSQSPIPTAEAIAHKKAKVEESIAPAVQDIKLEKHEGPKESADGNDVQESQGHEVTKEPSNSGSSVRGTQKQMSTAKHDVRFRGLFTSTESVSASKPIVQGNGSSEPAKHVATATVYIEGLMRPMQPDMLRKHLINLAAAHLNVDPTPELLDKFYLDSIKTHCFARFQTVEVAVAVRDIMHGVVWPDERNRKSLMADFIPDDKIDEWISKETSTQSRSGAPARYEVQYSDDGEGVNAYLVESNSARDGGFMRPPPTGPRSMGNHQVSLVKQEEVFQPEEGFEPINSLFKSTTAKPKIYYKPVSRRIADKRLDQFDELLSQGIFPRRGGEETRRITFEDGDFFVDNGPEYGAGARRNNARGRRGRGGRGRGR